MTSSKLCEGAQKRLEKQIGGLRPNEGKAGGDGRSDFSRWKSMVYRSAGNIEAAMAASFSGSGDKIQNTHESSRGIRHREPPSAQGLRQRGCLISVVDEAVQIFGGLRIFHEDYPRVPRLIATRASTRIL